AFLFYDPRIVMAIAAVFALGYPLLRRFMICGLIAYAAAPLILLPLGVPGTVVATVAAVAAIVLVAHRGDLRAAVASARIRASDRRGTSGWSSAPFTADAASGMRAGTTGSPDRGGDGRACSD